MAFKQWSWDRKHLCLVSASRRQTGRDEVCDSNFSGNMMNEKRGGIGKGFSRREGLRPKSRIGGWGAMGSPRSVVVDVQRGSHEVIPCSMEKSPLLHHPGNASSTGQCPQVTHVKTSQKHDTTGGLNKHHASHREEWSKREYPEHGQGHSHGNFGQRQWKGGGYTGDHSS